MNDYLFIFVDFFILFFLLNGATLQPLIQ